MANCPHCKKEVRWMLTRNNKRIMVDLPIPEGASETEFTYGIHQAHFATCPGAEEERRKKKRNQKAHRIPATQITDKSIDWEEWREHMRELNYLPDDDDSGRQ